MRNVQPAEGTFKSLAGDSIESWIYDPIDVPQPIQLMIDGLIYFGATSVV
jgi:hypothetical protein